jgi:hypothetical protein
MFHVGTPHIHAGDLGYGRDVRWCDLEDGHGQEVMTLFTVLAVLAISVMAWVFGLGKKVKELASLKRAVKKIRNINKFNRLEDEEAEKQVRSAGDNPVRSPWLRKK